MQKSKNGRSEMLVLIFMCNIFLYYQYYHLFHLDLFLDAFTKKDAAPPVGGSGSPTDESKVGLFMGLCLCVRVCL